MRCVVAEDGDTVHRYLAGTLPPPEEERFEVHLLECEDCQNAVREGAVVRAALRQEPTHTRSLGISPFLWAFPLAGAAALLLWLILPGESELQRLARVDSPPSFHGLPVRARDNG